MGGKYGVLIALYQDPSEKMKDILGAAFGETEGRPQHHSNFVSPLRNK
jgi:hypothetical protein